MTVTIYTIGYEGVTMDAFIATLRDAGVARVIDVRALPLSRRPGFSKSILAASLRDAGIDYVHLKALGTPKRGRDAAKKGDVATLRAVYDDQLALPEAQVAAAQMRGLAANSDAAINHDRFKRGSLPGLYEKGIILLRDGKATSKDAARAAGCGGSARWHNGAKRRPTPFQPVCGTCKGHGGRHPLPRTCVRVTIRLHAPRAVGSRNPTRK